MKKNRGKSILISSFIGLLLLAGLGFWRFGHYEVVVVRGESETEEHEGHEHEQHARKISDDPAKNRIPFFLQLYDSKRYTAKRRWLTQIHHNKD